MKALRLCTFIFCIATAYAYQTASETQFPSKSAAPPDKPAAKSEAKHAKQKRPAKESKAKGAEKTPDVSRKVNLSHPVLAQGAQETSFPTRATPPQQPSQPKAPPKAPPPDG